MKKIILIILIITLIPLIHSANPLSTFGGTFFENWESNSLTTNNWITEGGTSSNWIVSTEDAYNPTLSEKVDCPGNHLDWEYIREGQLIDIDNRRYHTIFKTMWESSKTSDIRKILYLNSVENGEHLIAEVEEDGKIIFMLQGDVHTPIPFDDEKPYVSAGFKSWTDEEMEALKKDNNRKLDITNCQLCGTPVDTKLWEKHKGLCEGCFAGINGREEDEWID